MPRIFSRSVGSRCPTKRFDSGVGPLVRSTRARCGDGEDAWATPVVQTDNSVYQITVLQPYKREVFVQGGAFFPERTRAYLSGSSFGGSCLKLGWVGIGLHMEFLAKDRDQWVLTSHVRSITVARSATPHPC